VKAPIIVIMLLALFVPAAAHAADSEQTCEMSIVIGSGSFGSMAMKPRVKPASALKNRNIVKQTYDYSCGAASAATIFRYYLGDPITEEKVIESMFKAGNVDKIIERKGFSLLDIKKFAEYMGYRAVGYKTDIEGLVALNKPSIVAVLLRQYKHFVIFKGIEKGRAFLADPALGNTTVSVREFEQMWYGNIALVIEPREGAGKDGLKIQPDERIIVSSADLRRTILYNTMLFSRGPGEF